MQRGSALSVDEIVAVLRGGEATSLGPGQEVTQLEHALQTAAQLRRDRPDDEQLAVAGLVHDIGQLLPGARDETHALDGSLAVQDALGERVAGIVALHVEAKRYLVATDGNYKERLADDSVASLGRQGGALTSREVAEFVAKLWAQDAVTLRRADDNGKEGGMGVEGLAQWVPILRQVSNVAEGVRRRPRTERGD